MAIIAISILMVGLPLRMTTASAQTNDSCTLTGSTYVCHLNEGTTFALPFHVKTGYVLFCSSGSPCNQTDSIYWSDVLAFTNSHGVTSVTVYSAVPKEGGSEFCDVYSGICIPVSTIASSTCNVVKNSYCPGFVGQNGLITFTTKDGNKILVQTDKMSLSPSSPTTNACNAGTYCDSSVVTFKAPAGTIITIQASVNAPNIRVVEPASGTYSQVVIANTWYWWWAILPDGSTIGGPVTSAAAYGSVNVNIK